MMIYDNHIAGNYYNKYSTKNPIARHLMNGFLSTVKGLLLKYRDEISSITELGCGEGNLASIISLHCAATVRACDVSDEIINQARAAHGGKGIGFYVKDVYCAGNDDAADLIVCCEVLEHLERPAMAMEKLSEISKKYCLLSVPDEPVWRIMNMMRGKYFLELGNTPGHINHWTAKKFCNLVKEYFEIIEFRKVLPWTVVWCSKKR